jgi:hypothetical protein
MIILDLKGNKMFKILVYSLWLAFHPVHVTITSLDYIPETVSFKVFVRMYFDDFKVDCKLNGDTVSKGNFSGDSQSSSNIVQKYISEKLIMKVNDKPVYIELKDFNIVDNEISMNLECRNLKQPERIILKNTFLTGLYSDQSNMVIMRVNDFEEGVKLTSGLTEQTFIIK